MLFRSVIDIGGQDVKSIKLNGQGLVMQFAMNDKCAAGTGRFLDVMSKVLEIPMSEMGDWYFKSKHPAAVSSTCTVFAESEVISLLSKNVPKEDIVAGVHQSIAAKACALVRRVGVGEDLTMTGGGSHDPGVATNYISIRKDMTIRQAMSELVKQAGENDNISTLYVVDENDKFYGAIDLKDLIIARADDRLEKLIARSYPYVTDHEKISDCIDRIVDYAERSLPVLNDAGKLVGIITSSDVVELVDDEMGDDYAKLGGLTSEEDLNEGVFESVKKRLPWLIALLFLGMLVSSVVGAFESVVAVLPIVICFQSMVLDMAGNVGTQSLAVTIRVLVDENLTTAKKLQLLWKEMRVGLVNGALLAVMALGFLGCYIHFFKAYAWGEAFLLSGCVGVALIIAMVVSSLVGTVIPMLFHKIHIDPAVASGPLITTINDLVAVVVYYGLAMVVLIDLFHLG